MAPFIHCTLMGPRDASKLYDRKVSTDGAEMGGRGSTKDHCLKSLSYIYNVNFITVLLIDFIDRYFID